MQLYVALFYFISFYVRRQKSTEERIAVSARWTWLKITIGLSVQLITPTRTTGEVS